MKALHLTYRFGPTVVGGAEHYLWMLSRALARLGVDVEVWTTKTAALPAISRFGVRWDNALGSARERVDGLHVRRYRTWNAPTWLILLADRLLRSRWRREAERAAPELPGAPGRAVLGPGWYPLETHGSLQMRWTARNASIAIRDGVISEVSFEALCPMGVGGRFEVNGRPGATFLTTSRWTSYRFEVGRGDALEARIALDRTWRRAGDPRPLGIAVKSIGYVADGRAKSLDLADDHLTVLRRAGAPWIASLKARALARPRVFDALFFLLRAPLSPGLLWNLAARLGRHDVVLAQMTPYSTLNYATFFGRRHGVPVVLLPHFHTDDDFYHLRHYYRAFRGATVVLAFSPMQQAFFSELGARAEVIPGGGVDPAEFAGADHSGRRFRTRFGLDDRPLLLFVGRKSRPKRYDLVIKAVDFLNEHLPCRLVMVGPDEDGVPIASPHVLYLGRQERATVLDAYYAADVFVMLSESESFGMAFLEAWMAGKPVIGNRACRAVADLIADGEDGFLCADELDCAERAAQLLLDRRLARRLGERGHEKVTNAYTWDAIARTVRGIYATVSAC